MGSKLSQSMFFWPCIPAYDGNEMALTIMRHSARTHKQLPAYLMCCNRRTRPRILVKEYKLFQGKEIPCKTFHLAGLMSFQNSHASPGDYCFTILGQLFTLTRHYTSKYRHVLMINQSAAWYAEAVDRAVIRKLEKN